MDNAEYCAGKSRQFFGVLQTHIKSPYLRNKPCSVSELPFTANILCNVVI